MVRWAEYHDFFAEPRLRTAGKDFTGNAPLQQSFFRGVVASQECHRRIKNGQAAADELGFEFQPQPRQRPFNGLFCPTVWTILGWKKNHNLQKQDNLQLSRRKPRRVLCRKAACEPTKHEPRFRAFSWLGSHLATCDYGFGNDRI